MSQEPHVKNASISCSFPLSPCRAAPEPMAARHRGRVGSAGCRSAGHPWWSPWRAGGLAGPRRPCSPASTWPATSIPAAPPSTGARCGPAGQSFAFIKATEATNYSEPVLRRATGTAAAAAGLYRGAYHFARPTLPLSSAVDQARCFVLTNGVMTGPHRPAGGARPGDRPAGSGQADLAQWTRTWLGEVKPSHRQGPDRLHRLLLLARQGREARPTSAPTTASGCPATPPDPNSTTFRPLVAGGLGDVDVLAVLEHGQGPRHLRTRGREPVLLRRRQPRRPGRGRGRGRQPVRQPRGHLPVARHDLGHRLGHRSRHHRQHRRPRLRGRDVGRAPRVPSARAP